MKISLCMIVRNEQEHLERCLRSVQPFVSEIIIVDTGSTDQSVRIARQLGAKVIEADWEHHFAKARNIGLDAATGEWIVVLDADEEADGWDWSGLEPLLKDEAVHGYYIKLINYYGEAAGQEYATDSVCRLFRNDPRIRFRGIIHEEITESIHELPGGTIASARLSIKHYGYLNKEIAAKNKNERNRSLILDALKQDPDQLLLRYALATEHFQAGEYHEAAEELTGLLDKVSLRQGYVSDVYLKAAYALKASGRGDEAQKVLSRGIALFPDFTDLLELAAVTHMETGKLKEAYGMLRQALRHGDVSDRYTSGSGSGTYRTHYLAAMVSERQYEPDQAFFHYMESLRHQPAFLPAVREFIPLCLLLNKPEAFPAIYERRPEELAACASAVIPAILNNHHPVFAAKAAAYLPLSGEQSFLLHAIVELQRSNSEKAWLDFAKSLEALPPYPRAVPYLWAAAVADGRHDDAGRYVSSEAYPELAAMHGWLLQPDSVPPGERSVSICFQLFLQLGAWDKAMAMLELLPPPARWSRLIPVCCGMLQAPSATLRQWCKSFLHRTPHPDETAPSPHDELRELVFYTMLALKCSYPGHEEQWQAKIGRMAARHPNRCEPPLLRVAHYWRQASRHAPVDESRTARWIGRLVCMLRTLQPGVSGGMT